jgi:hypothetical protein
MAGPRVSVTLNTVRLDALIRVHKQRAHAILDKSGFDIEGAAKANAPVDTGAFRSSFYVSGTSGGGSNYASREAEALGRNPDAEGIGEEKPGGEWQRVIGSAVNYGLIVELKVRPTLVPAVEAHRANLVSAWGQLCDV